MIILELMIKFLMMTNSVKMMWINELSLKMKYTIKKWMIMFIKFHHQYLIVHLYIVNHNHQKFNQSTSLLKNFIIPTLTLFTTLLRPSSTNQILFSNSTNPKPPTETLEPNLIYDHYRKKYIVFPFHQLPLWIINRFQKN